MKYLAVLGRQAEISIAELEALFDGVKQIAPELAVFESDFVDINRLGGSLKVAEKLAVSPLEFLQNLPDGKITLGLSDYSNKAAKKTVSNEALKLKKILVRHGRSVRVVENRGLVLSTATSLHNGLSGKNPRKVELIKFNNEWFKVVGVQDIEAYAKRDQKRPARDAKVGMLPPKLAQILINLCGILPDGARVLDPFCGTGVVLQEALLMGYSAYGTDIDERMVEYTRKNLEWFTDNDSFLTFSKACSFSTRSSQPVVTGVASLFPLPVGRGRSQNEHTLEKAKNEYTEKEGDITSFLAPRPSRPSSRGSGANSRQQPPKCAKNELLSPSFHINFLVSQGDATKFKWQESIDAVACEGYLGKPMSQVPVEIKLKEQKQECGAIILGFLKNLVGQIKQNTPVVVAAPAWLRENGRYERLKIVDEIEKLGYNVSNKTREGLIYHRDKQIVARDILILRKK